MLTSELKYLFLALAIRAKANSRAELPNWVDRIDALSASLRGQSISVDDWRGGLDALSEEQRALVGHLPAAARRKGDAMAGGKEQRRRLRAAEKL